jgi:hypothetical protein
MQVPTKQDLARITHAYNYWLKVPADKLIVVKEIDDFIVNSFIL